jgi:hypothetical protein
MREAAASRNWPDVWTTTSILGRPDPEAIDLHNHCYGSPGLAGSAARNSWKFCFSP